MSRVFQITDQYQAYFLTFTVVGWADVFTRKEYRDVVLESLKFCRENKGLLLYAYVIMSNHVHCIMRSETGLLSDIVRDFKRHTASKILNSIRSSNKESRRDWLRLIFNYHAKYNNRVNSVQFWTHYNNPVSLHSNEIFDTRFNYIHENPVKAGWVELPEDYLYSSARNYSGRFALIEIDYV